MKTSAAGRKLIQDFEQCRLVAYPDPGAKDGVPWTIGWGATGLGIGRGVVWTQQEADERFDLDLSKRETLLNNALVVPVTQGQFDALVSIVYNVGEGGPQKDGIIRLRSGRPSTLLRLVNAREYAAAADQFLLWVSPGSSVQAGLLRRRKAERELFCSEGA